MEVGVVKGGEIGGVGHKGNEGEVLNEVFVWQGEWLIIGCGTMVVHDNYYVELVLTSAAVNLIHCMIYDDA